MLLWSYKWHAALPMKRGTHEMMGNRPIRWMNINPVTQKNPIMLLQKKISLMGCTPMANVFYKGKITSGAA